MKKKIYKKKSNKYKFLANLDISDSAKFKLTMSLDRIVKGGGTALLTPFGKAHKPENILKEFSEIYNKSRSLIVDDLDEIEKGEKDKYGYRCFPDPWSIREPKVLRYYGGSDSNVPALNNHKPQFSNQMHMLRPVSMEKAVKLLKLQTSSGLPFISLKGLVVKETVDDFNSILNRLDPCLLGTRTQELGKTRNFWIPPLALVIFEMMYYRPVLDFQRNQSWRAALVGPDKVDEHVTQLILESVERDVSVVSHDFEEYDATAKKKLQTGAFSYFKDLYQKSEHKNIDFIAERFCNIPLVTPSGILTGEHGIPSGSVFTNEVGSTIQYLVARSSRLVFTENMQCQGDDGIVIVKTDNVDQYLSNFSKYGLKINKKKTTVKPRSGTFCRKYYDSEYIQDGKIGGIYPVYRALCRLVFPERWTNFEDFQIEGKDYYSIRAITILENCKHHPLFRELVEFVYRLDKYKLKYSENGLVQYVRMLNEVKGTSEIIDNQYGDNLKGIKNFETVKLINQLEH